MKEYSIITIHLDDFSGLETTMDSIVRSPARGLLEWIVIDGGSTPRSDKHRSVLASVAAEAEIYRSEADHGIYDAMNKGVALVNGKYFLFLNAGDSLDGQFDLSGLAGEISGSGFDMVWGKTSMQYPDGSYGIKNVRRPSWAWYGMPVCHQSVLFSHEAFGEERYDTSLAIAADYDLISSALGRNARVHILDDVISIHVAGGLSQMDKHRSLGEEHRIRSSRYGIPSWISKLISLFRLQMWKLSDASPGFNRLWRKWI